MVRPGLEPTSDRCICHLQFRCRLSLPGLIALHERVTFGFAHISELLEVRRDFIHGALVRLICQTAGFVDPIGKCTRLIPQRLRGKLGFDRVCDRLKHPSNSLRCSGWWRCRRWSSGRRTSRGNNRRRGTGRRSFSRWLDLLRLLHDRLSFSWRTHALDRVGYELQLPGRSFRSCPPKSIGEITNLFRRRGFGESIPLA